MPRMRPRTLLFLLIVVVLLAVVVDHLRGDGFLRGLGTRIHGPR